MARCQSGIDQVVNDLKAEIQHHVVDLSIRLAEVIIRHELPDGEMIRDLIVKTLEPVSDLQGALVRISSADMKLFGERVIKSGERGVGNTVEFAEDPNLQQGDVIVESRNGIFDARLNERLKLLKETLSKRMGTPESSRLDACSKDNEVEDF
jgi:flagellar biosynthesis/type III secretory pathway protein FliH